MTGRLPCPARYTYGKCAASQESEIQMAALNERNRISRDIHDNVGHLLSSALLQTDAIEI